MIEIVSKREGREIGHETWYASIEEAHASARSAQNAAERIATRMPWKSELQGITFEVREIDGLGYAKVAL